MFSYLIFPSKSKRRCSFCQFFQLANRHLLFNCSRDIVTAPTLMIFAIEAASCIHKMSDIQRVPLQLQAHYE